MIGEEDRDFERELIAEFLSGAPALRLAVVESMAAGDTAVLQRSAHTLKSHAAMFGASRLESICRDLEHATAEGVDAAALAESALVELTAVESAIRSQV
jgi:HPt (histidine-containing phosphotransfer) domain-containing protein